MIFNFLRRKETIEEPANEEVKEEYVPQSIKSPTHSQDVAFVHHEMILEKQCKKDNVYSFKSDGIKVVRYSPKVTIVNCELTDEQVYLLYECAKLVKDGHKLEFTRCY